MKQETKINQDMPETPPDVTFTDIEGIEIEKIIDVDIVSDDAIVIDVKLKDNS